jgi:hypothetical protein
MKTQIESVLLFSVVNDDIPLFTSAPLVPYDACSFPHPLCCTFAALVNNKISV